MQGINCLPGWIKLCPLSSRDTKFIHQIDGCQGASTHASHEHSLGTAGQHSSEGAGHLYCPDVW